MGSSPTGGVFLEKKEKEGGTCWEEKEKGRSRRAHSSAVEHRTAVPVVTGSNPVVPLIFERKKNKYK